MYILLKNFLLKKKLYCFILNIYRSQLLLQLVKKVCFCIENAKKALNFVIKPFLMNKPFFVIWYKICVAGHEKKCVKT